MSFNWKPFLPCPKQAGAGMSWAARPRSASPNRKRFTSYTWPAR